MASIDVLKRQIAALEAQVERAAKKQATAIAKVKKIMAEAGLTIEHLSGAVWDKAKSAVRGKGTASGAKKSARPPKYADPATGATWSGVGRAPLWIAGAKNRDEFLIANAGESKSKQAAGKKAGKRGISVKRAMAAKAAKAAKKPSRKSAARTKSAATADEAAAPKKRASKTAAPGKKAAVATKAAAPRKTSAAKKSSGRKAGTPPKTVRTSTRVASDTAAPADSTAGDASA